MLCWFPPGGPHLCEHNSIFKNCVQNPLRQPIHHRGIFPQQFFEFMER